MNRKGSYYLQWLHEKWVKWPPEITMWSWCDWSDCAWRDWSDLYLKWPRVKWLKWHLPEVTARDVTEVTSTWSDCVWSLWQTSSCSHSETLIRWWVSTRRDSSPMTVTCFATAPDIFLKAGYVSMNACATRVPSLVKYEDVSKTRHQFENVRGHSNGKIKNIWDFQGCSVPARHISEGAAPCPYCLAPCPITQRPARIWKKTKKTKHFFI